MRIEPITDQRELYDYLRASGEKKEEVSPDETTGCFPEGPPADRPLVLYSDKPATIRNLWKLGWLLGLTFDVVTPHILVSKDSTDHSYRYPNEVRDYERLRYYGSQFFEWRDALRYHPGSASPRILPAFWVHLHHDFDFDDEAYSIKEIHIKKTNLDGPILVSDARKYLKADPMIKVDLPGLLISDRLLVDKVVRDYPIAARELKNVLIKSYSIIGQELEENQNISVILERLNDEVVQPGLTKIKAERREIAKSAVLKAAADVVWLSLPLFVTLSEIAAYKDILVRMLATGLGLKLTHEILDVRSNLEKLKREPFFVASKLRLHKAK